MIQSMTGYSRAMRRLQNGTVTVELRSTNHRYLEVSQRPSERAAGFDGRIAQLVRSHLQRGRIEVSVTTQIPRGASRQVVLDPALAKAYYERLLELQTRFGLKGSVTLDHLLRLPNVVSVTDEQGPSQDLWPSVRTVLLEGLRELLSMRRREGRRLVADLRTHAQLICRHLKAIRVRQPKSIAEQGRRLRARLKTLLGSAPAATAAQTQEALALITASDIHEELVRLESHLEHLQRLLGSPGPVGKQLDFIAQELMRETNTIGAKANDAGIAQRTIEIKGAIEKIREQAQNLE